MSPSQHTLHQSYSSALNIIVVHIPIDVIYCLSTASKNLNPINIPPRRIRNAFQSSWNKRFSFIEKGLMNRLLGKSNTCGIVGAWHYGYWDCGAKRCKERV